MTSEEMLKVLREGFVEEAAELVAEATRAVLGLERPSDAAVARRQHDLLARQLHTLKGSSATVGLDEPSRLAHALEDLLAPARKEGAALAPPVVDGVLRALETLLARIRADCGDGAPVDLAPTLARLGTLSGSRPVAPAEPVVAEKVLPAAVSPTPATPAEPTVEAETELRAAWRVSSDDVRALVRESERLRELRLRIEARVGAITALANELGTLEGAEALLARADAAAAELRVDAVTAEAAVIGLEEIIRRVGTVRLELLQEPLRRTVRQVAAETGKQVRVGFVGEGEAIDRRVVEALRGPLGHLVRNAVVHGVELPDARRAAGKHPEGSVTVRFHRDGNLLSVSVEDDGGGIDVERVREAARAVGLAVDGLGVEQVVPLVFTPGLTTSRSVTNAAGRGVGLDVVRSEVSALGGRLEVESRAGQGARFSARVPIEIGSSDLLVVRAGEQDFGIPASAVRGVATVRAEDLLVSRGRTQFLFRGQPVFAVHLGGVLGISTDRGLAAGHQLMVVQAGDRSGALVVDAFVGAEDLVIRPLPKELQSLQAFNGVATLGDGRLLLVLRPDWLVERPADAPVRTQGERRVLVVDDSLTARALHRTILESAGWKVHTAGDAKQALGQLGSSRYDLVLCDIGMEGMDGFDLTRLLRTRADTKTLPIVLVSAHDTDEDRQRGLAAGADAFLSKRDCVSGRLLSEVSTLLSRARVER